LNLNPQMVANALLQIGVLLFALSFHECAHAWTANRFGDDTARHYGRISLNPLVHIDLFGTFLLPVILFLSNAPFMFGWAKPVPVNPLNLRPYRKGIFWVSAAGPLSNFILMGLSLILCYVLYFLTGGVFLERGSWLVPICKIAGFSVVINCFLGVFNLIPLSPLDGSKVLLMVLPAEKAELFEKFRSFGPIILIFLVITRAIHIIFVPFIIFLNLLIPNNILFALTRL